MVCHIIIILSSIISSLYQAHIISVSYRIILLSYHINIISYSYLIIKQYVCKRVKKYNVPLVIKIDSVSELTVLLLLIISIFLQFQIFHNVTFVDSVVPLKVPDLLMIYFEILLNCSGIL